MTNLDQTEKLVRYVAEMHDRTEEYNLDRMRIHKEIEDQEDLATIYDGIVGSKFCNSCEKAKMYDEKNDEFYCPIHE